MCHFASLMLSTAAAPVAQGFHAGDRTRQQATPCRMRSPRQASTLLQNRARLRAPAEQTCNERDNKQNQEYEKEHFRNFRGARGDASESEYCCYQGDDKKYQRIVEHL
jgi:hypothetical protein